MARRLQPILDAILADERCQGSTRKFVVNLLAHYTRKKSLSPGQRRALDRIEKQLAEAPETIDSAIDNERSDLAIRADDAGDDWAKEFVASLKGQLLMGRELSPRQKEILEKVKARHSDKVRTERNKWVSNFSSEMREKLRIAAMYYIANPPDFGAISRTILSDDDFVPTKRQYEKMVENKYTKKVIDSTFSEPKYKTGNYVMLRSTAPGSVRWPRQRPQDPAISRGDKLAIVLKTDAKPVISAARGSKVYSVLFFGETEALFIEERHLKKGKR